MLKNFLLLFIFVLLCACSQDSKNLNKKTFVLNSSVVSKAPLPKKYFIENYQKEELPLYGKKQLRQLQEVIKADISTITQFQKSDVLNLFGTPVLIKNEGKSELWQYKTSSCVLNFIWIEGKTIVSSIKTYNSQLDDTDTNDCLKDNLEHAYELEANTKAKTVPTE